MKKLTLFISLIVLCSATAFAQSVDTGMPSWVNFVLNLLNNSIPAVGPILVFIVKWSGLVAGVFTALSVFVQALLAIPELMASWSGAHDLAEKIKAFSDMVLPYLKYFSIFNVQKPPPTALLDK